MDLFWIEIISAVFHVLCHLDVVVRGRSPAVVLRKAVSHKVNLAPVFYLLILNFRLYNLLHLYLELYCLSCFYDEKVVLCVAYFVFLMWNPIFSVFVAWML